MKYFLNHKFKIHFEGLMVGKIRRDWIIFVVEITWSHIKLLLERWKTNDQMMENALGAGQT